MATANKTLASTDDMIKYLKEINIPEHEIKKLMADKITPKMLVRMSDETLAKYIANHSKRFCLVQFCLNVESHPFGSQSPKSTNVTVSPSHQDSPASSIQSSGKLAFHHFLKHQLAIMSPPKQKLDGLFRVTLHRGRIFNELLVAFLDDTMDKNLRFTVVSSSGVVENDADNNYDSLFRDVLSEFWGEFYQKCTLGAYRKVPNISHEFKLRQWTAVAKILAKGWTAVRFFPIELCSAFLEMCFFGELKTDILNCYMDFVNPCDRKTLCTALHDFKNVDQNDLMELLENADCRKPPNCMNICEIISSIAHVDLIQKPMYVICAWQPVLNNLMPEQKFYEVLKSYEVNSRNVLNLLYCSDRVSFKERRTFDFLKSYVKESNCDVLKRFLRYYTGSDLVTNGKIQVTFNDSNSLAKTPKRPTCNRVVELPVYTNFFELRSELNRLLTSNK